MTLSRALPYALCLLLPAQLWAEGSFQAGLNQPLLGYQNARGYA